MSEVTTFPKINELSRIDAINRYVVVGYVRKMEKALSLPCLQTMIVWLCLGYFYPITYDYFHKYDDPNIALSNQHCTITKVKSYYYSLVRQFPPINYAIGKLWISSVENVKVTWKLKMEKLNCIGCNVIIRIISDERQFMRQDSKFVTYGLCSAGYPRWFGVYSDISPKVSYAADLSRDRFSEGDTIKAILDLNEKSFEIRNDIDRRTLIKYKGIKCCSTLKYKLMVQIRTIGNSVTMKKCTLETNNEHKNLFIYD